MLQNYTTRPNTMTAIHPQLAAVTERIIERSRATRSAYLQRTKAYERQGRV